MSFEKSKADILLDFNFLVLINMTYLVTLFDNNLREKKNIKNSNEIF